MVGLAAGALASGLIVRYAPAPLRLVCWLVALAYAVFRVLLEVVSFDTHSLSAGPDLSHGVRSVSGLVI